MTLAELTDVPVADEVVSAPVETQQVPDGETRSAALDSEGRTDRLDGAAGLG